VGALPGAMPGADTGQLPRCAHRLMHGRAGIVGLFHFLEVKMDAWTPTRRALLACLLAAAGGMAGAQTSNDAMVAPAAASKQAQEIAGGDPARWYREDATAQQQWKTRQKEIGAALDEAKRACRQEPAAQRAGCLKAAQATYKEEMANARKETSAGADTLAR
jgi:hypothetical protein